jgi:molecular chaperone HscB
MGSVGDPMSPDPQLRADLQRAKVDFDAKLASADADLVTLHTQWDSAVDADDAVAKIATRDAMVALLNRRSYLRNLVRDVNDALDS